MNRILAFCLGGLGAMLPTHSANAAVLVFEGQVQRQFVYPVGTPQCVRLCPAEKAGRAGICTADNGDCMEADVKVLRLIKGVSNTGIEHFKARNDLRYGLLLPNLSDPIAVFVIDDEVYWTTLETRNGADAVKISFIEDIEGLDPASFHPDAGGMVLLKELLERLPR